MSDVYMICSIHHDITLRSKPSLGHSNKPLLRRSSTKPHTVASYCWCPGRLTLSRKRSSKPTAFQSKHPQIKHTEELCYLVFENFNPISVNRLQVELHAPTNTLPPSALCHDVEEYFQSPRRDRNLLT